MRADYDSTFTALERKSRTHRKELLHHVTASLEDVETRLSNTLKSNLNDYQLLEIEFRKNMKKDLYALRAEMEAAVRNEETIRTDMTRKLKSQESFSQELRAKVEELLVGRSISGGGSVALLPSGSSGGLYLDQQFLHFQHSLDSLNSKFSLDAMSVRKDLEVSRMDTAAQILELRKVVEGVLTNEEATARAADERIRNGIAEMAGEMQKRLEESTGNTNALLKNLYRNLEIQNQNQDVLAAQIGEMQAKDGAAAPPSQRKVTQSDLESMEERILKTFNSPTGSGPFASAVRDLTSVQDQHSRRLDSLHKSLRDTASELSLDARVSIDKWRKELAMATETKLSTIGVEQELLRRRLEQLESEKQSDEMSRRIEQLAQEWNARDEANREETQRSVRNIQADVQKAFDRQSASDKQAQDAKVDIASLDRQIRDLQASVIEKDKSHHRELSMVRDSHAKDLQSFRTQLDAELADRDRRIVEQLTKQWERSRGENDERQSQIAKQLRAQQTEIDSLSNSLDQTRASCDQQNISLKRLEAESHRNSQSLVDVEGKVRRNEEVIRIAEELARTGSNAVGKAASADSFALSQVEWTGISSSVTSLTLQLQRLQESQDHLLKQLSEQLQTHSAMQSTLNSFQRDSDRSIQSLKQEQFEHSKSNSNTVEQIRADTDTQLQKLEHRLLKEYNEMKLKVQDMEHAWKLTKKYAAAARDADAGTTEQTAGSDSGLLSPSVLAKDSAYRTLQRDIEEFQLKLFQSTQQLGTLRVSHEDVAHRVANMETEIADVRKRQTGYKAEVDAALVLKIDTAVFDRFKRDVNSALQSSHHQILSTAQTALATASQAKSSVETWQQGGANAPIVEQLVDSSNAAAPASAASPASVGAGGVLGFGRATRSRSNSPARRGMFPGGASEPAGSPDSRVWEQSITRRSASGIAMESAPDAAMRSARSLSALPETAGLQTTPSSLLAASAAASSPSLASSSSLSVLLPILSAGHVMLKHFSHGPPLSKLIFYSPTVLPDAKTGVITFIPESAARAGFIHWLEPDVTQRAVLPMNTLFVSKITTLYVGKHSHRAFQKPETRAVPDELCFSVVTPDRSLEVQATTQEIRDMWITGISALLQKYNVPFQTVREGEITRHAAIADAPTQSSVVPALERPRIGTQSDAAPAASSLTSTLSGSRLAARAWGAKSKSGNSALPDSDDDMLGFDTDKHIKAANEREAKGSAPAEASNLGTSAREAAAEVAAAAAADKSGRDAARIREETEGAAAASRSAQEEASRKLKEAEDKLKAAQEHQRLTVAEEAQQRAAELERVKKQELLKTQHTAQQEGQSIATSAQHQIKERPASDPSTAAALPAGTATPAPISALPVLSVVPSAEEDVLPPSQPVSEDEEDEEEEKPDWLRPSDHIVQITLRAE
jgi:predicted  nucleic acid-binding Zn-ribbon protein